MALDFFCCRTILFVGHHFMLCHKLYQCFLTMLGTEKKQRHVQELVPGNVIGFVILAVSLWRMR